MTSLNPNQGSGLNKPERTDIAFARLQEEFGRTFRRMISDDQAVKTVVVIPSLSLDAELIETLKAAIHYEERLLCLLLLLQLPHTRIIYVTSCALDPEIVNYYISLIPGKHQKTALQRLFLFSCSDESKRPLTEKILQQPLLIEQIRNAIINPAASHLSCFNSTVLEKNLAIQLEIPLYASHPDLLPLANKSGSRKIFRQAGLNIPFGLEDLYSSEELCQALATLKYMFPDLKKAVVKLNEGFSGEGNALFEYGALTIHDSNLAKSIGNFLLQELHPVAPGISSFTFLEKLCRMGGIAEVFIEGILKESPSVQCRIEPDGFIEIVSTHDQLLGGESNQVFVGACFPALRVYSAEIARQTFLTAEILKSRGIIGRFGMDFISVPGSCGWTHYAIEINLRKGGTTHPYLFLQLLTGGHYDTGSGLFLLPDGTERYYFSTDNFCSATLTRFTPAELLHEVRNRQLLFNPESGTGIVLFMLGAITQYGKMGLTCIGATLQETRIQYNNFLQFLEQTENNR